MKPTKLKTPVNQKKIFKQKSLSYHTKCILSKLVTDMVCAGETLDFIYMEENVFPVWPLTVVSKALDELAENDIAYLCNCDGCDEDADDCENMQLIFNPDFIEKACPYIGHCSCCNPAPVNFNVNYN